MAEPDYYQTLQVDPRAESAVIEAAYRKLAAKYHPDVNGSPEAGEQMRLINHARDVLMDPDSRHRYDAQRQVALGPFANQPGGGPTAAQGQRPTWVQTIVAYLVQLLIGTFVMTIIFEVMPRLKQFSIPLILVAIAVWFIWLKPYLAKNWNVK